MLKVYLVDDEGVVREGLKEGIPWAQYGFEFIGSAPDGEMALPQIRRLKPDVLITDIKMPFMDGLALSKLVHEELPETKIIIISGHDDFEFAREAIAIGVEQYLLKPITKAALIKTLEVVKGKIEEEREQKNYIKQFQLEAQEYEQYAQRKFFEQLISGTLSVHEIYEQAKKLDVNIDAEYYNIVLFTVQPQTAVTKYSQSLAELIEDLMGFFLRYPEYLLFRYNLMTYAVLVKGSKENIQAISRRCTENIERYCVKSFDSLNWYAALGEPVERLSGLPRCFARTSKILSYRHLLPENHILTSEVLSQAEVQPQIHT
ncbi:MAG: response regulator [Clostridia bacterium]|nr:response regulator [Clostridia bacterium]